MTSSSSSSSSTSTGLKLRSDKIYLVGNTIPHILGSKLPSKKQVLQYFIETMKTEKHLWPTAKATVREIKPFYVRAGLITINDAYAAQKIEAFYKLYKSLERSSKHKTEMNTDLFKEREKKFVDELDDLFDIAGTDLSSVSQESLEFLSQQRKKGRPGTITFARITKPQTPSTSTVGSESMELRQSESYLGESTSGITDTEISGDLGSILSSSSSMSSMSLLDREDPEYLPSQSRESIPAPPVVLNKNFLTERVVGELDRYKISDYAAAHLFMAILLGLGLDPNNFVCSRSSIHNERLKFRKDISENIKEEFKSKCTHGSIVHWDGKALENIIDHKKQERLPVKLTSGGVDQLLGVPAIEDGSGFTIADAVYDMLRDWDQLENVQCCCYDTTSSNTGCWNGAAVRLEQLLGRSLLNCPCRHHISEVLLGAAFELKLEKSSGPDVPMFKTFQESWDDINQVRYKSGVRDRYIKEKLRYENLEIFKVWVREQLKKPICRHDYKEFLELCLLFLGESLPHNERRTVIFHRPGPMHHARWMSKALYCLKMFMFREQVHLSEDQRIGLADICVFIIRFYAVYWFRCSNPIEAPRQDLDFIKNVHATREVDPELSDELIRKIANHLWYLADETIAFAFFDKKVPTLVKRKMVARLSVQNDSEPNKRVVLDINDIKTFVSKDLSDFVSSNTMKFFDRFNIDIEFLKHDPSTWLDRIEYKEARERMKKVKVVNDTAERSVQLMSEFNKVLTKNESMRQFILLTVSKFRAMYRSHHKKDLLFDEE